MTEADDLAERTCALCYLPIAKGCPGTLEHVTAQRDHYWHCLRMHAQMIERLTMKPRKPSKPRKG